MEGAGDPQYNHPPAHAVSEPAPAGSAAFMPSPTVDEFATPTLPPTEGTHSQGPHLSC